VPGKRATDREAHIHQRRWWSIRRLCVEGGRTYLRRSVACHGIVTEGGVIHSDRAAEVSSGRIGRGSDEGPNSRERQVGRRTR
jgi:hypothetical protein